VIMLIQNVYHMWGRPYFFLFTYLLTVSWPSSSVTNKLTNKHTNMQTLNFIH